MSDPLTIATIALTAAQSVGQANAARSQGNETAEEAERQAQTARLEASRQASDLRRRNAAVLARQRVRYAKGGIVLSGSPLDLLADAASEGELAVQDALYQGDAAAQAQLRQGDAARRRGQFTRRQGLLSTGIRLLGSIQ
jgi:hypothetical protein